MLTKFELTLAASFGMLLLTAESADAQIVTVRANYTAPTGQYNAKTQPSGTFSTPGYADGSGGKWRVKVNYGLMRDGAFEAFTAGDTPKGPYYSTVEDVGRGVTAKTWGMGGQHDWPTPPGEFTFVRAILQRSTDGGTTWSNEGQPAYDACK